ncbi:hypothetical protein ACTQ5J_05670 [Fundicoccus sp. Sow4_F4]
MSGVVDLGLMCRLNASVGTIDGGDCRLDASVGTIDGGDCRLNASVGI